MKIHLERLIDKVADDVYGSDERQMLLAWIGRNTDAQVVEISEQDMTEILCTGKGCKACADGIDN